MVAIMVAEKPVDALELSLPSFELIPKLLPQLLEILQRTHAHTSVPMDVVYTV